MSEEKDVQIEPRAARVWIHVEGEYEPTVAHVHFGGVSFEHMAQVLMGDISPKRAAFLVFDHITPALPSGKQWLILDLDQCAELTPIFAFGHELIDVRKFE